MLLVLFLGSIFCIYALNRELNKGILTVVFLNIGQGDSIYIESPTHNQMLIDGGPGKSVLRELGKVMPFYDRHLDVVLATHPDADHVGGLNDVLDKYKVDLFLEPGADAPTEIYKNLEQKVDEYVKNGKITKILARRGMIVDLGGGAVFQIFFPDQDVAGWETNDASIVGRLVYGNNEFLLNGDSPQRIEKYLISLNTPLESDVLKAGHHGSRTSSSKEFVAAVHPQYAVISAGLNNRYGHPHKEVLDILNSLGIETLRTDTQGRITFKSDGQNLRLK